VSLDARNRLANDVLVMAMAYCRTSIPISKQASATGVIRGDDGNAAVAHPLLDVNAAP
jgi:hypothetical protein